MSRNKLIEKLKKKNPKLDRFKLHAIIDIFSRSVANALKKGRPVEIRGFGRWSPKKLNENYNLRNPRTNELIYKPERFRIRFKASKKLNKIINE